MLFLKHSRQNHTLGSKTIVLIALTLLFAGGAALGETVAHWRFEEGPAGSDVISEANRVMDSSGHGNHLRSLWFFSTPAYITDTPFARLPETLEPNQFSLSFSNERFLYTTEDKPLNALKFDQWTLEASFKPYSAEGHQTILSKDGDSSGSMPSSVFLRKQNRSGRLEIGLVDGMGIFRNVRSIEPLEANEWYSAAATGTASEISLWLKGPGDSHYHLQGTTPAEGAFFNGPGGRGNSASWMVGRGMGNSPIADYFQGVVDEVRISDVALEASDFLAFAAATEDPAELEVEAVRVGRTVDRKTREFLAIEAWSPAPSEELQVETSSNLVEWAEISVETETIGSDADGRERLLLTSDIRLDQHLQQFLRLNVMTTDPIQNDPANPIFAGADPDILLVGDTLWLYPTFGSKRFYAFSSKDLVHWKMHGPLLYFWEVDWIPSDKHAWAPGIAERDGMYYLYYSVGPKPSHIGVAVSDSPGGPFVDSGEPLLSDGGADGFEAIDAMVFSDPGSGKSYFYAGGSAGATLRVFELEESMTSFAGEISVQTPPYFTEGAFMHYRDGTYYLSYSHGYWRDQTYSVHYATSSTPTGPWTYRGAILVSDSKHKGPGHHSIFHNPRENQWYIVYHRWNDKTGPGPYSGSRQIAIETLDYDGQGLINPVQMTDSGVGPAILGPARGR